MYKTFLFKFFLHAPLILQGAHTLWKLFAWVSGKTYRKKWVLVIDVFTLSLSVLLYGVLHFVYQRLYKPGYAWMFFIPECIYLGVVALFTLGAYRVDKAKRIRALDDELIRQYSPEDMPLD